MTELQDIIIPQLGLHGWSMRDVAISYLEGRPTELTGSLRPVLPEAIAKAKMAPSLIEGMLHSVFDLWGSRWQIVSAMERPGPNHNPPIFVEMRADIRAIPIGPAAGPSDEELVAAARAAIETHTRVSELPYFLSEDSSEYEPMLLALRAAACLASTGTPSPGAELTEP